MRRMLVGGIAALGLAGAGFAAFAAPGAAQESLSAKLSSTVIKQGESVTISSISPCGDEFSSDASVELDLIYQGEVVDFADATVADDGSWASTYTTAADEPLGSYTAEATCFAVDEEGEWYAEYSPQSFTVEAPSTPVPTTPVRPAEPAAPVEPGTPAEPAAPHPAAPAVPQPATPVHAQPTATG